MIYGIGIDLIKIKRMKEAVNKWGKKFLDKIFKFKRFSKI